MKFFATLLLLFAFHTFAQKGILPFSGLTYAYHGLSAKEIVTELDEATWTSNRLPVKTEFEIKMIEPAGFAIVDGRYYPGIEVAMLSTAGDTLGYIPDIMGGNEFEGFEEFSLKKLSLTLGFNELSKPGDTILICARFFDQNSENELVTSMKVIIADSELPLETAWSTYSVSSSDGYNGIAAGAELSKVNVLKSVTKKGKADYKVDVDSLVGITAKEWTAGDLHFKYYTEDFKEMFPSGEKELMVLTEEAGSVSIHFTIPLFDPSQIRFIRVRWENEDHSKVLDIVTEIKN